MLMPYRLTSELIHRPVLISLSQCCQLLAGRGGSSAAHFRALHIIAKHIRVTEAGPVMRQPSFALILLITSLRREGAGGGPGDTPGPGDACTLLAAQTVSQQALP